MRIRTLQSISKNGSRSASGLKRYHGSYLGHQSKSFSDSRIRSWSGSGGKSRSFSVTGKDVFIDVIVDLKDPKRFEYVISPELLSQIEKSICSSWRY